MDTFTPASALIGGSLIGLAASLAMLLHGKVAGISGLVRNVLDRRTHDGGFAPWFLAGLAVAGLLARVLRSPTLPHIPIDATTLAAAAVGGLLVGVGTRLGSGCTSGHGVCGLSRLSVRSLVATLTFIGTGMAAVAALRALGSLS
jgi:uncharacterized membrane protein YedE/YeeE